MCKVSYSTARCTASLQSPSGATFGRPWVGRRASTRMQATAKSAPSGVPSSTCAYRISLRSDPKCCTAWRCPAWNDAAMPSNRHASTSRRLKLPVSLGSPTYRCSAFRSLWIDLTPLGHIATSRRKEAKSGNSFSSMGPIPPFAVQMRRHAGAPAKRGGLMTHSARRWCQGRSAQNLALKLLSPRV